MLCILCAVLVLVLANDRWDAIRSDQAIKSEHAVSILECEILTGIAVTCPDCQE